MKFTLTFAALALLPLNYAAPATPSNSDVKQAQDSIKVIQYALSSLSQVPNKLQTPLGDKVDEKDNFHWIKETTKKGKTYEVGTPVHTAQFNEGVDWEVDDTWHPTDSGFASRTGITSYRVGPSSNLIYDFYIQIVTSSSHKYTFEDRTGDTYSLKVDDTSDTHIVRYNSDNPAIVSVSGY